MHVCAEDIFLAGPRAIRGNARLAGRSSERDSPPPAVDKIHSSLQGPAHKSVTFDEFVDSALLQEQRLAKLMINFNPIVETYVQELKHDSMVETSPKDDDYFLSRLDLTGRVPASRVFENPDHAKEETEKKSPKTIAAFAAGGFAQAVFPDLDHFDRNNYVFNFVRWETLGEVRCGVVDVMPLENSPNGGFVGRIGSRTRTSISSALQARTRRNSFLNAHFTSIAGGWILWAPCGCLLMFIPNRRSTRFLKPRPWFKAQREFGATICKRLETIMKIPTAQ